jgi:hypothetical protein
MVTGLCFQGFLLPKITIVIKYMYTFQYTHCGEQNADTMRSRSKMRLTVNPRHDSK